jgi:hypothetical protein
MNRLLIVIFLIGGVISNAQNTEKTFQGGEELKYRVHYGIVNAGYATLEVSENEKGYHFTGKGWTVGVTNVFFKVRDQYESFVDKKTLSPNHFVRRVKEGGYKLSRDVYFDYVQDSARVQDHKLNTVKKYCIGDVQDILSALYKIRSIKIDTMSVGDDVNLKIFIDREMFALKLVLLGNDVVSSKYGKIKCYKFRPYVQKGRVFKEDESLTIWISADKNKIPIRLKASLSVGSAKMDLISCKGLAHSFP